MVIVKTQAGEELTRLRGDRMNFGAAVSVIAEYERRHGPLAFDVVDLPEIISISEFRRK